MWKKGEREIVASKRFLDFFFIHLYTTTRETEEEGGRQS